MCGETWVCVERGGYVVRGRYVWGGVGMCGEGWVCVGRGGYVVRGGYVWGGVGMCREEVGMCGEEVGMCGETWVCVGKGGYVWGGVDMGRGWGWVCGEGWVCGCTRFCDVPNYNMCALCGCVGGGGGMYSVCGMYLIQLSGGNVIECDGKICRCSLQNELHILYILNSRSTLSSIHDINTQAFS